MTRPSSAEQESIAPPAVDRSNLVHDDLLALSHIILAELTLRHQRETGPDPIIAISPPVTRQQLIAREHDLLRRRQDFLRQSLNMYSALLLSDEVGQDTGRLDDDLAEYLPDAAAVQHRVRELAAAARSEVVSFRPAPGDTSALPALGPALDEGPLGRGLRVRTIYPDVSTVAEAGRREIQTSADAGVEVRTAASLPMSVVVFDGRTAVLPQNPNNWADGVLIVRQRAMVLALLSLFEARWEAGRPLSPVPPAPARFTPSEEAVLRLMVTGAKDDAVARQLGSSVRTVHRIVSGLMERADASSRFALGVHAAARGWV